MIKVVYILMNVINRVKAYLMVLRIQLFLSLVLLIVFSIKLNAQQLPQYSNYMLNNYIMNLLDE